MTPNYDEQMARMNAIMRQLQDTLVVVSAIQERQANVQRPQPEEIDAIRERQAESERIRLHIEQNLDEATDKLNALIELMDRHQREHGEGRA